MKIVLSILLLLILTFGGTAQKDTISSVRADHKLTLKSQIAPIALIATGTIIQFTELKYSFQESIVKTNTNVDDYLQWVPVAEMYLADALKVPHKNTVWNQTKFLIIAQACNLAVTYSLKYLTHVERPDGADYLSFPSGHTSFAFTNATVLYHEFRDNNIYLALSGYLFASATGMLRITNNKHWLSDVLVGAGVGILVTNLVYYFEPLKNWDPFHFNKNIAIIPDLNIANKRIGLTIRF